MFSLFVNAFVRPIPPGTDRDDVEHNGVFYVPDTKNKPRLPFRTFLSARFLELIEELTDNSGAESTG
jgi:hypothetical protein